MKRITKKGIIRALKYFSVGASTFLFDLLLLFIFVDYFGMGEVGAAGIAFLIAVTINYFISRKFVFAETERKAMSGYMIFIGFAGLGFVAVTSLMYLCVEVLEYNYLVSRIIIAAFVGIWNYLNNLYFNFKVHKK